jgi:hypothetical protein
MIQIDHDALLAELQAHVAADKLVKGSYWERGKGCAVGCTLHSYAKIIGKKNLDWSDHSLYDEFLGPGGQMLGRLEDCIFEGMTNEDAREWPERFLRSALEAVKRGVTLQFVGWKFLHCLLTDEKINPGISNPLVRDAIRQCADVLVPLTKGEPVDESAARTAALSAASATGAASAAWAAACAARSAAWAAASAESAARSAAWAARSAESAARSAEWSAEWSALSAEWSAEWSAASAESAARSAAYKRMSDKLVELMDAA